MTRESVVQCPIQLGGGMRIMQCAKNVKKGKSRWMKWRVEKWIWDGNGKVKVNKKGRKVGKQSHEDDQYSKSSATRAMWPRISPLRIRAGSIWAAMFFRSNAFRDVGPQPITPRRSLVTRKEKQKAGSEEEETGDIGPTRCSRSRFSDGLSAFYQ